jgi:ribosome assembly protein 1
MINNFIILKTHPSRCNAQDNRGAEVYMAIARVFSGVLKANQPMYVLGPKYDFVGSITSDNHCDGVHTSAHATRLPPQTLQLYMVMGAEFIHVPEVPSGNIVGILGLHAQVVKTGIISLI